MSEIKKNIIATLAYFDLFNYPLTAEEILLYLPEKCSGAELGYALQNMAIDRLIYKFEKFYTLKNDYFLIQRRVKGNIKAANLIGIAKCRQEMS